jgi:peptidoglycan hydrolase-like protein with peptidoglycan-binding domain
MNVEPWMPLATGDEPRSVVLGAQHLLREHGHMVTADGVFGALTAAAVSDFQDAHGLPVSGTIDEIAWQALVVTTRSGSTGEAVRGVQQFNPGAQIDVPPIAVDGSFGPRTADAVREFQRRWGLTIDGVAGRETWSFLQAQRPSVRVWGMAKVGQRQEDNWRVRAVQHLLNHRGHPVTVDGMYGPGTGEAMRQWQLTQRATEISTTCGQLDWPGLIDTARPGDIGHHVRAVQSFFPALTEDGVFDPQTEQAVRELQDVFLPPADGIVGPRTWHLLTIPRMD